jgi:hypothetical protein
MPTMQRRYLLLVSFLAGFTFCAISLGAATWLQASNDNAITACANKKTGVMRYLSKGKCNKKTETQVSWNSTGVAGTQGVPGPKGDTGAKGETGAQGESGVRARLVDATGKDLGSWSHNGSGFGFVDEQGGLWTPNDVTYEPGQRRIRHFRDSACTVPLIDAGVADVLPSTSTRWVLYTPDSALIAGYKAVAGVRSYSVSSLSEIYMNFKPRGCFNDKDRAGNTLGDYSSVYFWDAEEVPLPTYTPPLSVRVD